MGITAFYGASMEDEDAVKLLQAAYDMGYRCHGINKKEPEVARDGMRNLTDLSIWVNWSYGGVFQRWLAGVKISETTGGVRLFDF